MKIEHIVVVVFFLSYAFSRWLFQSFSDEFFMIFHECFASANAHVVLVEAWASDVYSLINPEKHVSHNLNKNIGKHHWKWEKTRENFLFPLHITFRENFLLIFSLLLVFSDIFPWAVVAVLSREFFSLLKYWWIVANLLAVKNRRYRAKWVQNWHKNLWYEKLKLWNSFHEPWNASEQQRKKKVKEVIQFSYMTDNSSPTYSLWPWKQL